MELLEYVYISLLANDFTPYRVLISQAFFHGLYTLLFVSVRCLLVRLNLRQFNIEVQFVKSVNYTFEQSL